MAHAKIVHHYPDGSFTEMVAATKADGPDALDECVRRVAVLWHIACQPDDEDDAEVQS
jgi:hypothetical protein